MRSVYLVLLACAALLCVAFVQSSKRYQCMPCGRECDESRYATDGTCSSCMMELVDVTTVTHRNLPASGICAYLKAHPKAVVLDVRTKAEFEGKSTDREDVGTLKHAINMPIDKLPEQMANLAKYKNREVIVVCSHAHRSAVASYRLTQAGFTRVVNLTGGMTTVVDASCKKKR